MEQQLVVKQAISQPDKQRQWQPIAEPNYRHDKVDILGDVRKLGKLGKPDCNKGTG
jgi:hypothetical protein